MVDRIQLRDVRESFFQSFLDRPNNWESLFLAYRFCGRGEGLLRHYWPKADKLFLEQLMRVLPLLDRATEFVRVRPLYSSEELIDLMAGAEVGDSYAGELYMAANPEIHQEILELWISIAETKPTSIPYPADKVVASLQQCLSAASDFADAADADKDEEDEEDEEEYNPHDVHLSTESGRTSARKSIVKVCEAFDFLGTHGWKALLGCFILDLEFLNRLHDPEVPSSSFEMPELPPRPFWVIEPPSGWLDYEPGTLTRKPINRVFVSYCWQGDEHKRWVEEFANWLTDEGLEVVWDMWDSSYGSSLSHFMQTSLEESDHVLIVLTPEYARRANQGVGGVGAEWQLMKQELEKYPKTTKFVGLLKEGDWEQSSPFGFQDRMGFDFRSAELEDENAHALLKFLHNLPEKLRFSSTS